MNIPILFIISGACSFGSQVTLESLNIPYQICITDPNLRASEVFRKINPTGKVGALKNGQDLVAENLAILLYLSDKYTFGPQANSVERTQIYQWLSYLSSTLHPAFGQYFYAERFVEIEDRDKFRVGALKRLHAVLTHIDTSLAGKHHFINNEFTIVDAQAYGLLRWALEVRNGASAVGLDNYLNIKNFLSNLQQLPAVKNALAVEQNKLELLESSKFAGYFTL